MISRNVRQSRFALADGDQHTNTTMDITLIGFTGTQSGMTRRQKDWLRAALDKVENPIEFHHGDCIGADEQADAIAREFVEECVIHPPTDPKKRAFCKGIILPEKPYLDRNKDIVIATAVLIAMPGEATEQLRSGTWSTVRFARKLLRPIRVIGPSGVLVKRQSLS